MRKENIYLDNHASTKIDLRVVKKMMPFYTNHFGNPHSSSHQHGWIMENHIDLSRQQISKSIGSAKEEIFFTSGATESNNLAIKGVALSQLNKKHIITCVTEHKCVLESCKFLEKIGFKVTYLKVDKHGNINLNNFEKKIQRNTFLVSLMAVNNEIGTIQPISEMASGVKAAALKMGRNILFHTDAVQAPGLVEINASDLGVDMLSLSAHKFHGPRGVGALYMKRGIPFEPLMIGGGQERERRSGTENVAGIVGMAKALELCLEEMGDVVQSISELQKLVISQIEENIPGVTLNGHPTKRICNNVNISFQGVEGEPILLGLDFSGICASSGSACSAASHEPSHVLLAIGRTAEEAQGTIRISLGRDNTRKDIDYMMDILPDLIKKLRSMPVMAD